jgi:hypothetical protein
MIDWLNKHGYLIFPVVALCISLLLIGGGLYSIKITEANYDEAYMFVEHDLELQGYQIFEGIINSPTVIQVTEDHNYFINAVNNTLPIYHVTNEKEEEMYIAVFNATYGLAYKPYYEVVGFWGL